MKMTYEEHVYSKIKVKRIHTDQGFCLSYTLVVREHRDVEGDVYDVYDIRISKRTYKRYSSIFQKNVRGAKYTAITLFSLTASLSRALKLFELFCKYYPTPIGAYDFMEELYAKMAEEDLI